MKSLKTILLIFIINITCFSFTERNVEVFSSSMNKSVPVTITFPNNYSNNKKYSTIYVLHGWSANNRAFSDKLSIGALADKYDVIYIAPDGGYNSWYVDSEIKENFKYNTFISKELIEYVDSNFSTLKNKENRAITGFSMGGYGALHIGINSPDTFGNIGSMSGGVNPEKIKKNYDIRNVMNSNWKKYNIKDIIYSIKDKNTNLIIDCGISDSFIELNRELHKKLIGLGIDHDYIERPGKHDFDYWGNSIEYQTFFFHKNFEKNIKIF